MLENIVVRGARQHNLKNIDLEIPRRKLTVITGLSGSGKSSLAFDTIYAEGQRRYIESLSAFARQFLEQMEKFRNQNLFLVYGARDKVEWVSDSRAAVEKLTAVGANFEYIELPEAGHMLDGAPWSEVMDWIMKYIQ